jgi:flagellar protein FliS
LGIIEREENTLKPYFSPLHAYKETRVRTAGQGKLIVMLYDEAIKQIDTALQQMSSTTKKLDMVHNSIVKAQDVVTELTVSLDFERGGEIAKNLFNLYMFFNRQLMEANVRKDSALVKDVRRLLSELRDAWIKISNIQVEGQSGSAGVNIAG